MCKFGLVSGQETLRIGNCKLFTRGFTNKGIGITFNQEIGQNLYKMSDNIDVIRKTALVNEEKSISNMKKAGSKHALKILLENNIEEVEDYEKTISLKINSNEITDVESLKPTRIEVNLHNPKAPSNIRSNSFEIQLGYSTTVYITPKATEIDQSGEDLSEEQRGCRLQEDNQNLDIFQVYTQEGCMLECKIRQAYQRCGCFPWNYLVTKVS